VSAKELTDNISAEGKRNTTVILTPSLTQVKNGGELDSLSRVQFRRCTEFMPDYSTHRNAWIGISPENIAQ
jgi:hypothetical protein